MDVRTAVENRRAYRSLDPVKIDKKLANELAGTAQIFCSCFNDQPWRYVFVYEDEMLSKVKDSLSKGNEWARNASMIAAVFSKKDYDCIMPDGREYFLFDTGMATGAMILRATELGLVAHPIAGYDQAKAKAVLNIPEDHILITLIIFGKHAVDIKPQLNPRQAEAEKARPERFPLEKIAFHNMYK